MTEWMNGWVCVIQRNGLVSCVGVVFVVCVCLQCLNSMGFYLYRYIISSSALISSAWFHCCCRFEVRYNRNGSCMQSITELRTIHNGLHTHTNWRKMLTSMASRWVARTPICGFGISPWLLPVIGFSVCVVRAAAALAHLIMFSSHKSHTTRYTEYERLAAAHCATAKLNIIGARENRFCLSVAITLFCQMALNSKQTNSHCIFRAIPIKYIDM